MEQRIHNLAHSAESASADLSEALNEQRRAFERDLPVEADARVNRLDRLAALLSENADKICEALDQDFGTRSRQVSMLTDVVYTLRNVRHTRKHVKQWMRNSRRALDFPLPLLGAAAHVEYQPKGVVGVLSPWNFPVYLALTPVAGAFAAGNRVMLKPSELTPHTSSLLVTLVDRYFDRNEFAVITGDASVGAAFSKLPFDHLVFTGGGVVGRHVMRAAADNLVPVTLELGGKSPVIVGKSADIEQAAERIVLGKLLNAGQICLAPDYVLVDRTVENQLSEALVTKARHYYPSYADNKDYVSIINQRHFDRLQGYIDEARQLGAEITECGTPAPDRRLLPLTIVRDASAESLVMRDEIFGPLLPTIAFDHIDDAIGYINRRDRPLGLYYFGNDRTEEGLVRARTISGGITINDVIFHVMQDNLPLGGIGPSGMGRYHGRDGFLEFSHHKSVYRQPRFDLAKLLGAKPPYGERLDRYIQKELKSK